MRSLNLDLNSFDGSDKQFYAIFDTLSKLEDKTQMVAVANDIFGDKLANNLLPLLSAGGDAIAEYAAEYENLGSLTNEQIDALAEFDNVLNTIKTQLANVALQIGASLLPIMQKIADIVSNSVVPKLQKMTEWFPSCKAVGVWVESVDGGCNDCAVVADIGQADKRHTRGN